MPHIARGATVAGLLALVAACSEPARTLAPTPAPAADTDTFIGVVRLTSPDPSTPIDLLPSDPKGNTYGSPIKLVGAPALKSVDGLRIRLVGTQAHDRRWPDLVRVLTFTVLSAQGQEATDGILARDAGAWLIVTADGRRRALVDPPPDLRTHVGARIWVAGPLDRAPVAYGIIQ